MARRDKEDRKKKSHRTDMDKTMEALSGIGGEDYWSPKEGKNTIRILPPWNDEGVFFFKGILHYGVEGESSAPIPCRENIGKDCPVCEALDKVPDKNIKRRLMGKTRFYMNIIDRNNLGAGVKIYGCSAKQMKQLRSQLEDPDFGDITDPEEGHDVTVEKDSASNPQMPGYDLRVRPKASPLAYENWEGEMHILDEVVLLEPPTLDEYNDIAEKLLGDLTESGSSKKDGKKREEDGGEGEEKEGKEGDDDRKSGRGRSRR